MQHTIAPALERADFTEWYHRNRRRSAEIFGIVDPGSFYGRPIPLRHPIAFYEGHLPAFSFITLARDTYGMPSIDARFETLFRRGIDPDDTAAAAKQAIDAWPSRDEVSAFNRACDDAVLRYLADAQRAPDGSRQVAAAYAILEHEQMHHETLLYILHQLPHAAKQAPAGSPRPADGARPPVTRVRIAAGAATIDAKRGAVPFGWDNEFEETRVEVPAFDVDAQSVTNADYLEFVRAGGPPPGFWAQEGGEWRQCAMFESVPLPLAWPVYATLDQARAYAAWRGRRLMTEAEYHRAAYGTPDGREREQPWGSGQPEARHGNLDFARFDPVAAGSHPDGASAWGVHDLVGNGWEWTATAFGPLPGFTPMEIYPVYSADFFDGKHFVVKGASPVTARELVRRSLRNWYRGDYPYIYAKFRCAG